MSYFDRVFVLNCKEILEFGSSDVGLPVRPHWEDGTPAHTKMIFNQCDRYVLQPSGALWIPIITLRKLNFKACVDEILWIYQKCSNSVYDLNSHIWDAWADQNGKIGRAYGYQIGLRFRHHIYIEGENLEAYPSAAVYDYEPDGKPWVWMNQIDAVIYDLRNNRTSRGIITNMFNHQDLANMALRPCAYSVTFNVEHRPDGDILHTLLNQRSQDMITANSWNVTQYAVLTYMIAHVCGLKAGSLTHMVANMHIYDRHEEIAKELIRRYSDFKTGHPNPRIEINPEVKEFKDFTVDDISLIGYEYEPFDMKIEVAV